MLRGTVKMNNQIASVVMLPELYTLLRQYQRLSYNPWTALSEFIDNSTESWFQNKHALISNGINGIRIDINYDRVLDQLVIKDSAYGMELDDFKRAVVLGSKPAKKTRSEYGFGLKTAACWFGNKWEVHSTQYDSPNEYSVVIDIDQIERTRTSSIDITSETVDIYEHGTTIIIYGVSQRMKDSRLKRQISQNLSFKYRRDIKNGSIKIYYNGEPITYEDPEILVFEGRKWIKDLDFTFNFGINQYNVTGFVGIFSKGTKNPYQKSGFGLFIDDRTIIGGYNSNYKPIEIFTSDPKSLISGKLFGEINLNDIPVNQAKDDFIWGDGLEAAFVNALKQNIKEFINVANKKYGDLLDKEPDPKGSPEEKENQAKDNALAKGSDRISPSANEKSEETTFTVETSLNKSRKILYSINPNHNETISIVKDNTIIGAYQLDKSDNSIRINEDHVQYKNASNKETYLKQCVTFAILSENLKIVYGNTQVTFTMLTADLIKRFFEIYNSLRDN